MKIYLIAFLVFCGIVFSFFWITNQQMSSFHEGGFEGQLDKPVLPTTKAPIKEFYLQNLTLQNQHNPQNEYINLNWEILSEVEKSDTYDRQNGHYSTVYSLEKRVQLLNNMPVHIQGYVVEIPDAPAPPYYVLSAYPPAKGFLAGQAGIETVVALDFENELKLAEGAYLVQGTFTYTEDTKNGLLYQLNLDKLPIKIRK